MRLEALTARRLLRALDYCNSLTEHGADPVWCLERAAHDEKVSEAELAKLWLAQVFARDRARQALALLAQGDEAQK